MKSSELTRGIGLVGAILLKINGGAGITPFAGAPVQGTSGTFAGTIMATPGSLLIDTTNHFVYQNSGTKASPIWSKLDTSSAPAVISASGAIGQHSTANYVITKTGSLAALTLAAPTAGVDDGVTITITSDTAFAHTVTCPAGVFKNGGAAVTIFTFTGTTSGGGLTLVAYNGTWKVLASVGGTFS